MNLLNNIESCHLQIKDSVLIVERLMLRVKELESQLNQNSRNSSTSQSNDKYKPKPAFPRTKGGKVGGKKGRAGGTLKMVSEPDYARTTAHPKSARKTKENQRTKSV